MTHFISCPSSPFSPSRTLSIASLTRIDTHRLAPSSQTTPENSSFSALPTTTTAIRPNATASHAQRVTMILSVVLLHPFMRNPSS